MLLNDLQKALEIQYSELQEQINLLQEEQKRVQAKMQQVGSVESKIESALALLSEGLRDAREVCPDQIELVKKANLSLYDDRVLPLPVVEETTEEAVEVEVEETEIDDFIPPVEFEDEEDEIDETVEVEELQPQEQEQDNPTASELEAALSFKQLRSLAKDKDINAGGKASAIAARLQGSVTATELEQLQASQ